jgi:hypothetical protein
MLTPTVNCFFFLRNAERELRAISFSGFYELKPPSRPNSLRANVFFHGDDVHSLIEHAFDHLRHIVNDARCSNTSNADRRDLYFFLHFPSIFDAQHIDSLIRMPQQQQQQQHQSQSDDVGSSTDSTAFIELHRIAQVYMAREQATRTEQI